MNKKAYAIFAATALAVGGIGYSTYSPKGELQLEGPAVAKVGELVELKAAGASSYSWIILPDPGNQKVLGDTLYFSAMEPGVYQFVVAGDCGVVESRLHTLRVGSFEPSPEEPKFKDWLPAGTSPTPVVEILDSVINRNHESVDSLLIDLQDQKVPPKYKGFMFRLGAYMEANLAGTSIRVHLQFLVSVSEALK